MSRHLLAEAQPVNLSDYMVPVSVGGVAGLVAGVVARVLMDGEHTSTKDAAAFIVNSAVSLLVGGLVFVHRQRRRH